MKTQTTNFIKSIVYSSLFLVLIVGLFSCKVSKKKKSNYAKETFLELKKTFPNDSISLFSDSIKIIFPNNIMFTSGSAELLPEFDSKMIAFAKILNRYKHNNILITGHTDSDGEDADNIQLSKNRANQVKSNLLSKSIDSDRLFTWGLGEKSPIASNETDEGKAINRRVEFIILYE